MAAAVAQRPMLLGQQRHGRWGKRCAAAATSSETIIEATVGQLQALPEHGSLVFSQTRTQTELQPLAGPSPSESDDEHDTQALPGIECVDSHEEEHDDTKPQHTRAGPLSIGCPFCWSVCSSYCTQHYCKRQLHASSSGSMSTEPPNEGTGA